MRKAVSTLIPIFMTWACLTTGVRAQDDKHTYVGDFGWHKPNRSETPTIDGGPVESKFRDAPIPKEIQMQLFNFKEALARSKADPKAQVTILGKLSCSKSKLYLQPVLPTGKATNDKRVRIVPKKTLYDQKVLTNKTVVVNGNFDKANNFHADSVVEWKGLFQTK